MNRLKWVLGSLLLLSVSSYAQIPQITAIGEISGVVDQKLTISGNGFHDDAAQLCVRFGGVKGTIVTSTENIIEVLIPAGAQAGPVTVTNNVSGLTGYSEDDFFITFPGDGTASAVARTTVSQTFSNQVFDIAIADFNDDGLNDAIFTKDVNGSLDVSILKNTSTGFVASFTELNRLSNPELGINAPTSYVGSGDVDGDGKVDFAVARTGSIQNQIYVFRNTSSAGDISFASPVSYFLPNEHIAQRIVLRDMNRDGKAEMIVSNSLDNEINIFLNSSTKGNINFASTPENFSVATGFVTFGLEVADLNGDKKPEIIVSSRLDSDLSILENASTESALSFVLGQTVTINGNIAELRIGDLNGDRKPDLIVTKIVQNKVAVLLNDATDGSLPTYSNENEFDITAPRALDIADMNGDGLLDFVVTSISSNTRTVFENSASSPGLVFTTSTDASSNPAWNTKLADMNGDAKPDEIYTTFNTPLSQYAANITLNQQCISAAILPEGPITICTGAPLKLETDNALNVTFEWLLNGGVTKTGTEPFIDVMAAGTYEVRVIGEAGNCSILSNSVDVTFTTGTIPADPVITNTGPVCEGQDVTLEATNVTGATFLWSGPNGFSSTDQNAVISGITPLMAGEYTVVVSIGFCTSAPLPTLVEVVTPPAIEITPASNTNLCAGQTVLLDANIVAGYDYQWKLDNVDISGQIGTSHSATLAGLYTVVITSTTTNCSITSLPSNVIVVNEPIATFTVASVVCSGTAITFTNTSTTDAANVDYAWDFGDGGNSTDSNPQYTFASGGTFDVELTVTYQDYTCNDIVTNSITVEDEPMPTITLPASLTFCENDSLLLQGPAGFLSYSWSSGENTQDIYAKINGSVQLIVETAAGCQGRDEVILDMLPAPDLAITASDTMIMLGASVELLASGSTSYQWSPGISLSDSTIADPVATPDSTTTYTVSSQGMNGCIGYEEVTIYVDTEVAGRPVIASKAFTPNGDTIDDTWNISNLNSFSDCSLNIFDRQGILVFETTEYNNDWDGLNNGQELPEGVYFYVFKCDDNSSAAGSVVIIR